MIYKTGMLFQKSFFYLLTSGEYYSYQRGMSSVSGVSYMKNCLCAKSNSMIDFYHFFSGFSHCFEFFDEVFCQSWRRINHFAKVLLHGFTFLSCEFILAKILCTLMHINFRQVRSIWLWIMLCSTNLVFTFKV